VHLHPNQPRCSTQACNRRCPLTFGTLIHVHPGFAGLPKKWQCRSGLGLHALSNREYLCHSEANSASFSFSFNLSSSSALDATTQVAQVATMAVCRRLQNEEGKCIFHTPQTVIDQGTDRTKPGKTPRCSLEIFGIPNFALIRKYREIFGNNLHQSGDTP